MHRVHPKMFRSRFVRSAGKLSSDHVDQLVQIGLDIEAIGAAAGFGGAALLKKRPRVHQQLVRKVASRHGLDPNLLFAVMRVESTYQDQIVSYAGAVGLLQIMPRTGRHIAQARGHQHFSTTDLLDPATNLDYGAWYLKTLIERFDGRLPLAVAAYNGGPHNVRKWLSEHSPRMPLDVFVEHIPFTQTHRYVRRVLSHYRAYRAQVGLDMIPLEMKLPRSEVDKIAF